MLHVASSRRGAKIAAIVPVLVSLSWPAPAAAQEFSAWSPPISLGSVVNTASTDGCPSIAKNELTLFFASNRPGGYGGLDIYVTQRDSVFDPWETPLNAGPAVNGPANELCPTLATNARELYFVSDRAGGCGAQDLYVARRADKRDDFSWQTPENLGCLINSPSNDFTPSPWEDESTGRAVLYFSSNRPGGPGGTDIYYATSEDEGVFGVAAIDWSLSTSSDDQRPHVRKDGLEIFFDSNRPGSLGADLWTSTRADTADPWSPATNLGATVNSSATEGRPSLSFDGRTLYFMSSRPGGSGGIDLYVTDRSKVGDKE